MSIIYLYDFVPTPPISERLVGILASPYITEFNIPTPSSVPNGIGVDKKGNVWFVENEAGILAMLDRNSYLLTEYKIPADIGEVWSLKFDTQGNLWFTDSKDRIWRFDTIGKSFRNYEVPTKGSRPTDLAIDTGGRIWITQIRSNYSEEGERIAVFDPSKEAFTEYKLGDRSGPAGIALENGNIWITQTYANNIAKFNKYDLSYKQFTPSQSIVSPIGIAVDARGTVWFAQHGASKISGFVESNKTLFEFATSPNAEFPITTPYWIAIDSKQNIWFNEHSPNKIAKFIKANNTLVEYKIPSEKGELVNALTIALDQDDNLWFTEWTRNRIGVVNSNIPVPFTVDVSAGFVNIEAGKSFTLEVTVRPGHGSEIRNIYFNASGTITPTGEFVNSTIIFDPEQINLDNSSRQAKLFIHTKPELTRGVYNMTISASDGFITYARIVKVEVL